MKVIAFCGSTGIVGKSVLLQCLLDPDIESVLIDRPQTFRRLASEAA